MYKVLFKVFEMLIFICKLVRDLFYKYIYTSTDNPLRIKLFIDLSTQLGLTSDMVIRPGSDLLA